MDVCKKLSQVAEVTAHMDVCKKLSQVAEVTAHLEKSIHTAKAEFTRLRERLSTVVMPVPQAPKSCEGHPKGEKVQLAELLESFANMVDALASDLQDTNTGLEL